MREVPVKLLGWLALAAFVVGWVVIMLAFGCGPSLPPPCPAIERIKVEGWEAQDRAGCKADPERLCPDLLHEYDRRIDAVPDEACP